MHQQHPIKLYIKLYFIQFSFYSIKSHQQLLQSALYCTITNLLYVHVQREQTKVRWYDLLSALMSLFFMHIYGV